MIKILRTYDNKLLYSQKFNVNTGFLYPWYITNDIRNIAAVNWDVPTNNDCKALADYLGAGGNYNSNTIGGKLKETGTVHWYTPNADATNEVGFNARAGGIRYPNGTFIDFNNIYRFWTKTDYDGIHAYCWNLQANSLPFGYVAPSYGWGHSIRLIYKGTGTPTLYRGNNGQRYKIIQIGSQFWMAENLAETHFRTGEIIPEITDNTEWSLNTTGARCSYNNIESNAGYYSGVKAILRRILPDLQEYGLLYNGYTIVDTRKITSSDDWQVITADAYNAMCISIGGYSVAGGKLKETGLSYWETPNTGATNEIGFNARGTGWRHASGGWNSFKYASYLWTNTSYGGSSFVVVSIQNNSATASAGTGSNYNNGNPVRLMNPSTLLPEGSQGIYIGNDGTVYGTKVINGVEYMTSCLCETRFRTGEIIPWHGSNPADYFTDTEWSALITSGCCAYNNELNNVKTGFSFPT